MAVDKELLKILACPQCKGDVRLNKNGDGISCSECKLVFPVKDDIPIMLLSEAKKALLNKA